VDFSIDGGGFPEEKGKERVKTVVDFQKKRRKKV